MKSRRRFIHAVESHTERRSGCMELQQHGRAAAAAGGETLQCCSENHEAEKIQVSIKQREMSIRSLSLCLCVPRSPSVTTLMVNLKLNEARKDQHTRADMFLPTCYS